MATASRAQINAATATIGAVPLATMQKAMEVLTHVDGSGGVRHMWGYDPNVSNTEHHSGLALDFMLYNVHGQIDTNLGWRIRAYLWANRKRLGVRHIIYRQHIISTVVAPGDNRLMGDRGNPTANHFDHVHVMFFPGAYKQIPAKTSKPRYPGRLFKRGSRGSNVVYIQRMVGAAQDGIFGPKTEAAVKRFQKRNRLSQDGEVGPKTWAKF